MILSEAHKIILMAAEEFHYNRGVTVAILCNRAGLTGDPQVILQQVKELRDAGLLHRSTGTTQDTVGTHWFITRAGHEWVADLGGPTNHAADLRDLLEVTARAQQDRDTADQEVGIRLGLKAETEDSTFVVGPQGGCTTKIPRGAVTNRLRHILTNVHVTLAGLGLQLGPTWVHCSGESSKTSALLLAYHPRTSVTWIWGLYWERGFAWRLDWSPLGVKGMGWVFLPLLWLGGLALRWQARVSPSRVGSEWMRLTPSKDLQD